MVCVCPVACTCCVSGWCSLAATASLGPGEPEFLSCVASLLVSLSVFPMVETPGDPSGTSPLEDLLVGDPFDELVSGCSGEDVPSTRSWIELVEVVLVVTIVWASYRDIYVLGLGSEVTEGHGEVEVTVCCSAVDSICR